jgi:CheY-like chemotaxis protein
MTLSLPTAAAPIKRARYGKTPAYNAVVLIVEDEALIRMNAVQMIDDAGYVALEASNADDAIAVLKRRRDIGAVFTDINMSGSRSGLELAHAIREGYRQNWNCRWAPTLFANPMKTHMLLLFCMSFLMAPKSSTC